METLIKKVEEKFLRKDIPEFKAGDTVRVHVKITELKEDPKTKKMVEKTRIQPFEGVVLERRGSGLSETFTVRRVTQGIGVERTFLINSPFIEKIEVVRRGKVRKAKIFWIRGKKGKKAKIKEQK
ncbi:MAG: 50S ribosomal protein L19 [Candidatus Hydrothermales bacterium]